MVHLLLVWTWLGGGALSGSRVAVLPPHVQLLDGCRKWGGAGLGLQLSRPPRACTGPTSVPKAQLSWVGQVPAPSARPPARLSPPPRCRGLSSTCPSQLCCSLQSPCRSGAQPSPLPTQALFLLGAQPPPLHMLPAGLGWSSACSCWPSRALGSPHPSLRRSNCCCSVRTSTKPSPGSRLPCWQPSTPPPQEFVSSGCRCCQVVTILCCVISQESFLPPPPKLEKCFPLFRPKQPVGVVLRVCIWGLQTPRCLPGISGDGH